VTAPCEAELVGEPEGLFVRAAVAGAAVDGADASAVAGATGATGAVDVARDYTPVSWLRITLTEGKFHQVRKMVAAIGHRCIRLVRVSIEELTLEGLRAGEVREVGAAEFFERLKIRVTSL
jgi:23S rRNA pseudouridine2457 synthase